MSKISDKVEALARPVVEEEGCRLWSVEYIKEAGTWYLRVYIDKDGGVGIADCEAISRKLDPILDEADPVPGSYVFEGSEIEVKLYRPYEGRKTLVGLLEEYSDGDLTVSGIDLKKEQIAQVKLHVTI